MNHCFSNTISTQTYLVYTLSKKHTNPNLKKLPVHYSIPVTCYCILICTAFYVPNLIGCQEFFTPRSFHSARNFFVSISIHNPTHPLPMPVSMLNVSHTILKKKSASISNIVKQGGGGRGKAKFDNLPNKIGKIVVHIYLADILRTAITFSVLLSGQCT